MKGFDFNLDLGEVEDTKLGLLLDNHDGNDNLDSNLYFIFSRIAIDERRNKKQKQWINTDYEKKLEKMTKPLKSEISSKSES